MNLSSDASQKESKFLTAMCLLQHWTNFSLRLLHTFRSICLQYSRQGWEVAQNPRRTSYWSGSKAYFPKGPACLVWCSISHLKEDWPPSGYRGAVSRRSIRLGSTYHSLESAIPATKQWSSGTLCGYVQECTPQAEGRETDGRRTSEFSDGVVFNTLPSEPYHLSSAQNFLGRRLRTVFDLMIPYGDNVLRPRDIKVDK